MKGKGYAVCLASCYLPGMPLLIAKRDYGQLASACAFVGTLQRIVTLWKLTVYSNVVSMTALKVNHGMACTFVYIRVHSCAFVDITGPLQPCSCAAVH